MKTKEEIKQYALEVALGHFFVNVGEDEFPDDPMALLATDDTSDESGKEKMFPWEPFEYYPARRLYDEVEALASVIERAMLWAQEGMLT
jgi:hypothetical protein